MGAGADTLRTVLPMPRNGGGGLRFSLFGFPIRIHPWFLIVAGIIGFSGPEPNLARALVWIGVVLVSVLVHELGHAFAARTVGAEPTIDLYALGGLTAFAPPRPLGRWQSVGISLAGPFAGFLLGFLVLSGAAALGTDRPSPFVGSNAPLIEVIVGASIWVNLYWGVVNLLPILPLDGGNVVRSLLPGGDDQRDRLATGISLGAATVIVIALLQYDFEELILLPLLLGALNLQALISERRAPAGASDEQIMQALSSLDRGDPGALRSIAEIANEVQPAMRDRMKVTAIEVLLRNGRVDDARQALAHLPGAAHPSLYALVDVAAGDPHAQAMLDDMVRAQPLPSIARYALLGRVLAHRSTEVPGAYLALPPDAQAPIQLREMQYLAHLRGDYQGAAAIGELQIQLGGAPDAWVLYNTACSWSCAGENDRALLRLGQAVDAGWSDAAQLDTDQDLAPLWVSDRFREIRRRLAGTTPAF
jgi:Zn-dependent protease